VEGLGEDGGIGGRVGVVGEGQTLGAVDTRIRRRKKGDSKGSPPRGGGGKTRVWNDGCFHCHSPDHIKKDCPGHKKFLESHARRDAQTR